MKYTYLNSIIVNISLIIFPLIIYLLIICYQKKLNTKNNNLILDISLITSLFLCLRFGYIEANSKILLFCNIPVVIAFIKKRNTTAITLSLANILFCIYIHKTLMIITILKYISYFILYYFSNKKKLNDDSFILSVAVIQGFFLSFEYFFQAKQTTINDLIELLILVFIYYFSSFLIVFVFKIIDKLNYLTETINSLEKDKNIKNALFKLTHEIKNPLAVCKGYLDIIDLNKKDKAEKYINIMKEEINRSLDIMQEFLEFNKIKIKKEPFDINYLLENVYESFKILINSKKIKLYFNINNEEEIYINGDYERIKQVIINLIKNSVESIVDSGQITLSTKKKKDYLILTVEDTGIGMKKEELERLTEMFFTTKQNGTGLGVALSNEIIKAHNGELTYSSEYGKGTIAKIKLPYN